MNDRSDGRTRSSNIRRGLRESDKIGTKPLSKHSNEARSSITAIPSLNMQQRQKMMESGTSASIIAPDCASVRPPVPEAP